MIYTPEIWKFYKPLQPAVNNSEEGVLYREFLPESKLQKFIYRYWQLKTVKPLDQPFNYVVVADGCVDIFFELDSPDNNFIMGFSKQYTTFPLGTSFNYVGVRFLPAMIPQLFGINASELSDRVENLRSIIPGTSDFISQSFDPGMNEKVIKNLLDNYFIELLSKHSIKYDNRFYEAVDIIMKNYRNVRIESDLNTGLSSRQLRRQFEFYIGSSAKKFIKVVRFQNVLRSIPSSKSLRLNKQFFDTGYYDQAHFIKEFKTLFGETPGKTFRYILSDFYNDSQIRNAKLTVKKG